ncbi:ATP-binding protein [Desulfoglaeba alkanexedens]|uniref:histidine kinase n=1 Tax=Desulfoglaeba alkanexedens ALDC TaxID=980445 RepID=A0A4P8L549_9BACT|nr:ATP-binding protein [Desulfoglaeba alkanexedens]QCQ23089.1 cell wall metabolism sensor histidine kinase WalK [Desulfoglaeba alkanexedens ALDC]
MRSLRYRTRLFLVFWMVVAFSLCLPIFILKGPLENLVIEEAVEAARKHLEFVYWSLEHHERFTRAEDLERWCEDLARHLGFRVTVIAEGGVVIADSHVPNDRLPFLDNHAARPEVMEARHGGVGMSIRYSATLQQEMVYVARRIEPGGGLPSGVLRLAVPFPTVKGWLDRLYPRLWAVLALTLGVTGGISYVLSRRFEEPIQKIVEAAQAIGKGEYQRRIHIDASPEFNRLAKAINEMASRIGDDVQRLTFQKSQLETILDSMKEGVMVLDRDGRIRVTNRSLMLLQRDPKPQAGKRPLEVFLSPELQKACDEVLLEKDQERLEIEMEGNRFYDINLVRIPGPGTPGGAVVVFHDITDIKRLERVRRDFVANVSHELRTPLTSIKGYAETLLESPCAESEETRSFLQTILKNANHMSRMVNDLLQLTRLEVRGLDAPLGVVDAAKALESAWETCALLAQKQGIGLQSDFAGKEVPVYAVRDSLVQVFQNLLNNAIRYSPAGSSVRVSVREEGDMAVFQVEDEGPGIPVEHQSRIFERFYRVDKQRGDGTGGTGLGLAICRHIVRNLGGRIWVESPPQGKEHGSAFCFSLKRAVGAA